MDVSREQGLEQLLAHAGWARGLARRLAGNAARADDLLQSTWLAALQRAPPHAELPARSWLARVLRRLARHQRREEVRRRGREACVARRELCEGYSPERVELQETLLRAVTELREPYRSTVWARYFDELPPRAIAARDGVGVKTVKARLARGLAHLRARLAHQLPEDERSARSLVLLPGLVSPFSTFRSVLGAFLMKAKLQLLLGIGLALVAAWWGFARWTAPAPSPAAPELLARLEGARDTSSLDSQLDEGPHAKPAAPARPGLRAASTPVASNADAAAASAALARERLDSVLDSFYGVHGQEPRVDELQAWVPELAAALVIDEASVRFDEGQGVTTARASLAELGLEGTLTLEGDEARASFPQFGRDGEWRMRTLDIGLSLEQGRVRMGSVTVQHHLDPGALPDALDTRERATGWCVSTSREVGTVASPIVSRRSEEGRALVVGHPTGQSVASIAQPGDWDLRGYEPWRARLEPLLARAR